MRLAASLLACAALALPAALRAAENENSPGAPLWGATVESVAYDSDGPVNGREVARLVEVEAGGRLDPDTVRRSIQNLYATERFANIVADARATAGGGVNIVFHLFRSFRIGTIDFPGAPIAKEDLRRDLGFRTGEPFLQSEIEEGKTRIARLLSTEGYSEAKIEPRVRFDRTRFEANVSYEIERGPVTRVGAPIFDGRFAPFTSQQLLQATRLEPGDRYREEKARRDAARIQAFLLRQGRLKAEVNLIGVDFEGAVASLVYRVSVGPIVAFETRGVEEKRVRKDFLSLLKDQVFQEDLLLSYVESLRRQYQESGYHDARVDYHIEESPDRLVVTLTVDRGSREHVAKIDLDGVKSFPQDRIRGLMLTRPRSLFHRGYLVDSILEDDRKSIEGFYRVFGFTRVEVPEPIVRKDPSSGELTVTVRVKEGPQTIVRERRIEGDEHVDPAELAKLLETRVGKPLDGQKVANDRAALTSYYHDHGWTHAAVEPSVNLTEDRSAATVVYPITEGEREFFGKTIVRGNTRTKLDRILIPVRWLEGDPFSESKILETQRELARNGVFQKIDIGPTLPDPATPERNMIVDVTEGRPLSLLYGVGYQYFDETGDQGPFGILGVSYNNLFGSLRSVSVETRYSPTTRQGRVFLNYRDPYFILRDVPLSATVFYAREPVQKIDITRRGAFLEGTKQLTPRVQLAVRYEYQKINVGSDNPLDIAQLQSFDRSIAESAVGTSLIYEGRDDPINPHRGIFLIGLAKGAFPVDALSADAKYVKFYAQGSAYLPVFGGVLAGSVRAGIIRKPSSCSDACVPVAERFFSGGRTSNRGFDTDIEGIPGETVDYSVVETPAATPGEGGCPKSIDPVGDFNCNFGPRIAGGTETGGLNLEWRFPIAGSFGGTLFWDATQVWSDGRIHLKFGGEDGLRQSVGVGLRYLTPVGPVRLEYGRVLNPRTISAPILLQDRETKTITPTGRTAPRRESADKIFLSIGYPF